MANKEQTNNEKDKNTEEKKLLIKDVVNEYTKKTFDKRMVKVMRRLADDKNFCKEFLEV